MSADSRNTITLAGGIVSDPEVFGDKVAKFRIAIDYAGNDSDTPDNRTGYFVVKHFLGQDVPNLKFIDSQIRDGKLKKGSQVILSGRLVQSRYTANEQRRSDVEIYLESLNYSGSRPDATNGTTAAKETVSIGNLPPEF